MVEFLCWLDQAISVPSASITESDLADKLLAFRQQQDGFLVPSFNPFPGRAPMVPLFIIGPLQGRIVNWQVMIFYCWIGRPLP